MANTVKRLAVLGCTGSIGRQTLEVVRALPARFEIVGLAGGSNTVLLQKQVEEFSPKFVYYQPEKARRIKRAILKAQSNGEPASAETS